MRLEDCFQVLEISPDASLVEAKQSYRELAQIWHPDRFANSPQLLLRAQQKMQQINSAYDRIVAEMMTDRQMLVRRLREGAEFRDYLKERKEQSRQRSREAVTA